MPYYSRIDGDGSIIFWTALVLSYFSSI